MYLGAERCLSGEVAAKMQTRHQAPFHNTASVLVISVQCVSTISVASSACSHATVTGFAASPSNQSLGSLEILDPDLSSKLCNRSNTICGTSTRPLPCNADENDEDDPDSV
jgi:hypothetical protein